MNYKAEDDCIECLRQYTGIDKDEALGGTALRNTRSGTLSEAIADFFEKLISGSAPKKACREAIRFSFFMKEYKAASPTSTPAGRKLTSSNQEPR